MIEAETRDVSSNGLLFAGTALPETGIPIEFTLEMPAAAMGESSGSAIQGSGRVVRHQTSPEELLAAAVIDQFSLKAKT